MGREWLDLLKGISSVAVQPIEETIPDIVCILFSIVNEG